VPFPETSINHFSAADKGNIYIYLQNGEHYLYARGTFTKKGFFDKNLPVEEWGTIFHNKVYIGNTSLDAVRLGPSGLADCYFKEQDSRILQASASGRICGIKLSGKKHWFELDSECKAQPVPVALNGIDDSKLFFGRPCIST